MPKFKELQNVKHLNGGIYRIRRIPDDRKLEHNGEAFYEYESIADGQVWIRCVSEMEDGRFVETGEN